MVAKKRSKNPRQGILEWRIVVNSKSVTKTPGKRFLLAFTVGLLSRAQSKLFFAGVGVPGAVPELFVRQVPL